MDIKGSRTEQNLLTSFAGESQARNRYTYFASQAKKDGFVQVQRIFEETANQEREHAKRFFKLLQGGEVEVKWNFPAGVIATTLDNLKEAAGGEHYEWAEMYPGFAEIARQEGFKAAAELWDAVSVAEKNHERRYLALAANIEAGRVFVRETPQTWYCANCGYLHEGPEAPQSCPACAHKQEWFQLLGENW